MCEKSFFESATFIQNTSEHFGYRVKTTIYVLQSLFFYILFCQLFNAFDRLKLHTLLNNKTPTDFSINEQQSHKISFVSNRENLTMSSHF